MKTLKSLPILCALLAVIITGCRKPDLMDFTLTPSPAVVGQLVFWEISASNIRSVTVNFGDGTINELDNAGDNMSGGHTYTVAGTYTVTVTVKNKNGKKSDSMAKSITITP
jgi:PKD repeat protein